MVSLGADTQGVKRGALRGMALSIGLSEWLKQY